MTHIKPIDEAHAHVAGSVARAVSLYLSGRFKPPRLTLLGPFVRVSLVQFDHEQVADALSEAELFSQVFTAADAPKHHHEAGTHAAVRKAATNSELLRPLVRQITHRLLKHGVVTSLDFAALAKGPAHDLMPGRPPRN